MTNEEMINIEVTIDIDGQMIGFDIPVNEEEWYDMDADDQQALIEEHIMSFQFWWTERNIVEIEE